jgi:hypothetical protein
LTLRAELLRALFLATGLSACGVVSYSPPASEVCGHIRDTNDRAQCERQLAEASSRERAEGRGKAPGPLGLWASSSTGLLFLWWGAYYLIGLVFARFVYMDARKREWLAFRVGPFWSAPSNLPLERCCTGRFITPDSYPLTVAHSCVSQLGELSPRPLTPARFGALPSGELKIAKSLPEANAFVRELTEFRASFTDAGHLQFGARVGQHDDLVLAAALAVWGASRSRRVTDLHISVGAV